MPNTQNMSNIQNISSSNTSNTQNVLIHQAEHLWRVFFNRYNENYVLQSVQSFFQSVDKMEPFFYFMMAKQILVDHMLSIIEQHPSLCPLKIIPHVVDGWVDFFVKMNYTLGPSSSHDDLEKYRNKTYQILSFLITKAGDTLEHLPYYYQLRLRNYFLIYSDYFQSFQDDDSEDECNCYDGNEEDEEGYEESMEGYEECKEGEEGEK